MTQQGDSLFDGFAAFKELFTRLGEEIREVRVQGQAGNGMVTATALATGQIVDIAISARAVREYGPEELSRMVLAAVQDATARAHRTALHSLEGIVGGPASYQDLLDYVDGINEELGSGSTAMRTPPPWRR
ncbi:MAG: hypothetical protein GEV03_08780 [Streptosporangiales bacterium]|nr:hypothetical protein [Streptosporangiales bacterium]